MALSRIAPDRYDPAVRLDMLPQELMVQIISHLDTSSLKSIRLCCKSFQHEPNKALFKTFHLYPHQSRFEDFVSLSRQRTIRECVQSLIYDLSYANFGELIVHQRRWQGPPGPSPPHTWWHDALVKSVDETTILSYLQDLLPALPGLTNIRVVDLVHPFTKQGQASWSYSTAPEYYQRLMVQEWGGLSDLDRLTNYHASAQHFRPASVASCILRASSVLNISLDQLKLEGITTTDILRWTSIRHNPRVDCPSLTKLRMLCINFGCVPRSRERAALASLPVLLAQCTSLCYLSLDFGALGRDYADFDSIHPYTDASLMDDLFPNTEPEERRLIHSPNLRLLDLRGFRCKARDYASIIGEILYLPCPNFIGLFLMDLSILPQEEYIRRPCLVDLVKLLRNMQLMIVQLSSLLTNCGNQKWLVGETSEEGCLYSKVHDFMLWQGEYADSNAECPLEFVAVQEGQWDVNVPTEDTEENQKWKGDESWKMDNHHGQGEGGIWVPVEMMLYFDKGRH